MKQNETHEDAPIILNGDNSNNNKNNEPSTSDNALQENLHQQCNKEVVNMVRYLL